MEIPGEAERRRQRARAYFDTIWTPEAAEKNRQSNFKYHPDLCKRVTAMLCQLVSKSNHGASFTEHTDDLRALDKRGRYPLQYRNTNDQYSIFDLQ